MPLLNFIGPTRQLFDNNGDPLSGGKVYFYQPGTLTPVQSYTNSGLATANAHPVILDSGGRAGIWINENADVQVHDSADVVIYTEEAINPETIVQADSFNLAINGSFESNSSGDGVNPDNWTLTVQGSAALDTSEQRSGAQSLRFIASGAGGGQALMQDAFEVSPLRAVHVSFMVRANNATIDALAELIWYDNGQNELSTTTIFDPFNDTSEPQPINWQIVDVVSAPPASARYARLRLTGGVVANAQSGTVWFDNVIVALDRAVDVVRTGDIKLTTDNVPDPGWICWSAGSFGGAASTHPSIGNGSSNATTRANQDTARLFAKYYDDLTALPLQDDSGNVVSRGTDAATDFAANRRLVLPDILGRVLGVAGTSGDTSNVPTTRATGDTAGEEAHQLSQPELPSVNFTVSGGTIGGTSSGTFTSGSGNTGVTNGAAIVVSSGGSDIAHNTMQPTFFLHVHARL